MFGLPSLVAANVPPAWRCDGHYYRLPGTDVEYSYKVDVLVDFVFPSTLIEAQMYTKVQIVFDRRHIAKPLVICRSL